MKPISWSVWRKGCLVKSRAEDVYWERELQSAVTQHLENNDEAINRALDKLTMRRTPPLTPGRHGGIAHRVDRA